MEQDNVFTKAFFANMIHYKSVPVQILLRFALPTSLLIHTID